MTTLVGKQAPDFTAGAAWADGSIDKPFHLASEIKGKHAIVFFYPLDFTFVCPSELIALDNRIEEFNSRNTVVIGVSIDSKFTHNAWRKTPVNAGGIGPVRYPIVADVNHSICQAYGVEHPTDHVALRGTFIIDTKGIVRSQIVNDLPIGRNIDELIRIVDAVQFNEQHGEVCPAGWNKGDKAINPTEAGISDYLTTNAEAL